MVHAEGFRLLWIIYPGKRILGAFFPKSENFGPLRSSITVKEVIGDGTCRGTRHGPGGTIAQLDR